MSRHDLSCASFDFDPEKQLGSSEPCDRRCLEREIDRLRTVIKTGGALYRLERAAIGIPGGLDPEGQPVLSADEWKDDEDRPLPEDDQIKAAFPTRSGRHDLYAEAQRLVSARYSKYGLVALVTWLLYRAEQATLYEREDVAKWLEDPGFSDDAPRVDAGDASYTLDLAAEDVRANVHHVGRSKEGEEKR